MLCSMYVKYFECIAPSSNPSKLGEDIEAKRYIGCFSGGGNPLYGQAGGYFEVEMAEKSMIKDEYDNS